MLGPLFFGDIENSWKSDNSETDCLAHTLIDEVRSKAKREVDGRGN